MAWHPTRSLKVMHTHHNPCTRERCAAVVAGAHDGRAPQTQLPASKLARITAARRVRCSPCATLAALSPAPTGLGNPCHGTPALWSIPQLPLSATAPSTSPTPQATIRSTPTSPIKTPAPPHPQTTPTHLLQPVRHDLWVAAHEHAHVRGQPLHAVNAATAHAHHPAVATVLKQGHVGATPVLRPFQKRLEDSCWSVPGFLAGLLWQGEHPATILRKGRRGLCVGPYTSQLPQSCGCVSPVSLPRQRAVNPVAVAI